MAQAGNPFLNVTCGKMDSGPAFQAPRNDVRYNPSTALVMMLRWISFEPP
jgi:hypothetical protein